MPPKKIPRPTQVSGSDPNRFRVAQYNVAMGDKELHAYTAGQRAAKRRLQGMGGTARSSRHDHASVQVAHDMLEEGRIQAAHDALELSTASMESWDDADAKERDAFRQGYADGFKARIRKLAYPGVRLNTAKQLDAEIEEHLRSRR